MHWRSRFFDAAMQQQMLDFDQLHAPIGTPELLALGKRDEDAV